MKWHEEIQLCGIGERGLDGLSVLGLSDKCYLIAASVKMVCLVYRYAIWNEFRMLWIFQLTFCFGFQDLDGRCFCEEGWLAAYFCMIFWTTMVWL